MTAPQVRERFHWRQRVADGLLFVGVRLVGGLFALVFVAGAAFGGAGDRSALDLALVLLTMHVLLSAAQLGVACFARAGSRVVQLPGLVADFVVIGAFMQFYGARASFLYGVLLVMSVLHARRCGLGLSTAGSLTTFAAVAALTPFWAAHLPLVACLMVGLALMPPLALLWLRGELDGVSSQRADFAPARFEVAEPIRQKSPLPAAERIAVPLSIASPAAARDDNAGARIISLARAADASRRRTEVMPATPALIASGAQILAFDDPFARHRARVAPLRVLVADDQAATRLLLSSMLEKAGHSVVTVEGGEQLLDHLVQHRVDVVLADVHMPGLCGLEAVRQARFFDHDDQRTPFIAISADASEAARTDAVDAGFTGFLAKPVGAEQLLGTLVAVCAPGDGATSHGPVVRRAADNTVVLDIGLLADLCDLKLGFDFVNRFIDQCARDTVACLADLERSGRDGDWRLLVEALRALEGVARMGGANRLAARCAEHLRTGPRDRWSAWRSTLDDLRLHAQAVREQLPLAMETMRQRYDAGRGGRR